MATIAATNNKTSIFSMLKLIFEYFLKIISLSEVLVLLRGPYLLFNHCRYQLAGTPAGLKNKRGENPLFYFHSQTGLFFLQTSRSGVLRISSRSVTGCGMRIASGCAVHGITGQCAGVTVAGATCRANRHCL